MGRWSHYDTDEEGLREGMKRIGYDADDQTYTYRDADGSIWESAPGNQYGPLTRVSGPPSSGPSGDFDDDDHRQYSEHAPLAYDESGLGNNYRKPSWRHEMMPLLNFLVIVGLVLVGVFWFVSGFGGGAKEVRVCDEDRSVSHEIVKGDTCWSIAEGGHVDLEHLLEENEDLDCDRLIIGSTVCVPKA